MKRFAILICIAFCGTLSVFPQNLDDNQKEYLKQFAKGSLAAKMQVLQETAANEDMEFLFVISAEFLKQFSNVLSADSSSRQLAVQTARAMAAGDMRDGADALWALFECYNATSVRQELLKAYAVIGRDNSLVIQGLNEWLKVQNEIFSAGTAVDEAVISECIRTLGALKDPSSFLILFSTTVLNYSFEITRLARTELLNFDNDFKSMLVNVLENNGVQEKQVAFEMGMESDNLTIEEKGFLSEKTLEIGLYTRANNVNEKQTLRTLRFEAARAIRDLQWSHATAYAIEHFNTAVEEYDRGLISKNLLLEAIDCLGALSTYEAASRLILYLDLIIKQSENRPYDRLPTYDEEIMLSLVYNLGELGYRDAFDSLLLIDLGNFSEPIKKAVKEAFNKINP